MRRQGRDRTEPTRRRALVAVLLASAALAACGGGGGAGPTGMGTTTSAPPVDRAATMTTSPVDAGVEPPPGAPAGGPELSPVEAALEGLELDERIGQLFMTYAYGSGAEEATDEERAANRALYGVETPGEVVTRYHLGGVILLERNPLDPARPELSTGAVQGPAQIEALTSGLKGAAVADSGIVLLVAVDQEGGPVNRIGPPATPFPSAAALGRAGDLDLVEAVARATADELAAMGINQNLAPVADVALEPASPVVGERAYGADPLQVAEAVAAAVRGVGSAGVIATAKHFPGHGGTVVDSHVDLPVVDHSREEWRAIDRPPFAAAVDAGVPVVMTGHVAVPALDPTGAPATLSAPILAELRDGIGFDGVIMTDALGMAGVAAGRSPGEVAVGALLAGADLLLMPADLGAAVDAVRAAVDDGTISEVRLDESVRRILAVKASAGALQASDAGDLSVVGGADHQRLLARTSGAG